MSEFIVCGNVPWGSQAYIQSLALRHEVLRQPLGLVFDPDVFKSETNDFHVIAKMCDWVVGCMVLTMSGTELKMRQVAVDPRMQRTGIGTEMVMWAEDFAKSKGYTAMVLHARDAALAFYFNHNYVVVGDGFYEVGIPHHAMRKQFVD